MTDMRSRFVYGPDIDAEMCCSRLREKYGDGQIFHRRAGQEDSGIMREHFSDGSIDIYVDFDLQRMVIFAMDEKMADKIADEVLRA